MSTLRVPRVKTRDDVVWVVFCAVVCEGEVCVSAAVCEGRSRTFSRSRSFSPLRDHSRLKAR